MGKQQGTLYVVCMLEYEKWTGQEMKSECPCAPGEWVQQPSGGQAAGCDPTASPCTASPGSAVSSGPALGHVPLVSVFTSHVGSTQSFSEQCISF